MTRDHPRLRGGTNGKTLDGGYATGPSPPTRGNQCYDRARRVIVGTIPAYAGEPYRRAACAVLAEDHPRLRGGTKVLVCVMLCPQGPSPPARGNRQYRCDISFELGTIPAYAGEPADQRGDQGEVQDHPRLRGGTCQAVINRYARLGPSPPTRGNRRSQFFHCGFTGTIPAYAGEPTVAITRASMQGDHPRLRGGTSRR